MGIEKLLASQGYKLTRQRLGIIGVICRNNSCMSAEEIFLEVKKIDPSTNLSTVYRTIDLLCEKKLLTKVDFGDNKYRYQVVTEEHCHHAICLGCKKRLELPECPVKGFEKNVGNTIDFKITGHRLEVYGYCPNCQA